MRGLLSYKAPTQEVERTTLRIKADSSGNIYLPIAGYSEKGVQNCPYKWKISIDGGTEANYEGTGTSSQTIRVGYGLKPLSIHTVTVKPQVEEYGWCRALSFYGTSAKTNLINIISDKSYMGYAKSATDTGDFFKFHQYDGCSNLLDTDDENLPDTVIYIGNNYRAYEYSGCTSLKNNAKENIHKGVRKIGNGFRWQQYLNCTSLTRVNIRAINRASVGTSYRQDMLYGAGNSDTIITVEGGIIEGGSWGVVNARVGKIKVYKDLVSDYQSMLSGITSSKIVKNGDWDSYNYEYIEFKIKADSNGDIKIPVAGLSDTGFQNCEYDWIVSVDGEEAVEYSGTGSTTPIKVGEGTAESEHRIIIEPKTVGYGWGRAFGFYNSGIASLITEFVHDSYKAYASSYYDCGGYFRAYTFYGCTGLTTTTEKLPTSVTTLGNRFYSYGYHGCTGLTSAHWEVIHGSIGQIGTEYRNYMFYGCSALKNHLGLVAKPSAVSSYPTYYRRNMFTNAGNALEMPIRGYEALDSGLTNSMGLTNAHVSKLDCTFMEVLSYQDNTNWSNISVDKFNVVSYPYDAGPTLMLDGGLQLEWTRVVDYDPVTIRDSEGYTRDTINLYNYGLGLSDDEEYTYFTALYDRAGYRDSAIIYQKTEDIGNVHLVGSGYTSSWYVRNTSPRGSQHDCSPKGITVYTGGTNSWWCGWDWMDYNYWGYGWVYKYSLNGYTPTFSGSRVMAPFYYSDSNNNLDRFLGSDRLGYNLMANERGITVYKYKQGADESLGSEIGIHVEFSDDGKYCYILKGTTITQYQMSKLLQFKTRVSTGKTFNIPSGCGGFTIKGGHLYCNNGTTVYKYSIPSN